MSGCNQSKIWCTIGIVFFHLQLSDEIMQSSLANSTGKKSRCMWLHTVTEPVLIVAATVCAEETSDGVYASVRGYSGQQLSNEQYKVVYDFEAQVQYLCMRLVKSFNVCFKGCVLMSCFCPLFSVRTSSRCLAGMSWSSLTRVRMVGGWSKEMASLDWFQALTSPKCEPHVGLYLHFKKMCKSLTISSPKVFFFLTRIIERTV